MGRITLRGRVLQTIVEIAVGVILTILISFIVIYFLYGNRTISTLSIKEELNYNFIKKEVNIDSYLEKIKVNFVIFDHSGNIKNKYISDSNLIMAKESFDSKKNLNTSSGEYVFLQGVNDIIIIRIPTLPEFTDIKFQKRYHFNSLFNNTVLLICFVAILIPILRFINQIKKEFLILESCILGDNEDIKKQSNLPKIIEVQNSMDQVNEMKKTLFSLVEKEKSQKEDLLFQTSALSHDIKTPLTIIKGNAGLLEYCDNEKEEKECIDDINSGIESIENYLDQMISYAKWSFYPEEKEEVRLEDLVNAILKNIKGFRKDIDFEVDFNPNDKSTKVYCSKLNLIRAVTNILNNAYKYAKTKVTFSVFFNETLNFTVYNDGRNIDEKVSQNIGKLFFTENNKRNSKDKHYGIGLYFAKNVALDHKGSLDFKNLGEGVEFSLKIENKH